MKILLFALLFLLLPYCTLRADDSARDTEGIEESASDDSLYLTDSIWTSSDGRRIKLAELAGRPVVMALFYTNCDSACPLIIDAMKRLEKTLGADEAAKVRFVLVSFDTEADTPEELKAYARKRGIDRANWELLRGSKDDTQELAVLLGSKFKKVSPNMFAHSNLIVVLDGSGRIAARVNALDQLDLLVDKVRFALKSGGA